MTPAAMFIYITWPWRHIWRHCGIITTKALCYQQPNNNLYQALVFKIHQKEEEMQTAK
jgi:hypothetical protein